MLSVIIPALNEESNIVSTIRSVLDGAPREGSVEVLVVDGGSSDATCRVAAAAGAHVLLAPRGRGPQLNAGWRAAAGDVCLFLHADTRLPAGYRQAIEQRLGGGSGASCQQAAPSSTLPGPAQQLAPRVPRRQRQQPVWGCFSSIRATELPAWQAALLQACVSLRTRLLRLPYGDQGLFVRRDVLQLLGGFREWGLMEDVDLVQRLNRLSPPAIVDAPVATSARRWQRLGFLRTTLVNQALLLAYAAGVPPARLAAWYYGGQIAEGGSSGGGQEAGPPPAAQPQR